ncbi:hypothetical protein EPN44_08540 [bacterium]|nr:MAG: hypothetical protein EPN44_08540 [bacterium]
MLNRFLVELIDDAGLFPPASLSMEEALDAHDRAGAGRYQWIVGRFIVPASRLDELETCLPRVRTRPLMVSVILDEAGAQGLRAGVARARKTVERGSGTVAVELFETRLREPQSDESARRSLREICDAVAGAFDEAAALYVELPSSAPDAGLRAVARERVANEARTLGAKIRCGGLTADLFPSPEALAHFIATAAALSVPFKATAGLHHPLRHVDSPTGFAMHGFLNIGAAAVFAHAKLAGEPTLREILSEEDAGHFTLTPAALRWRELVADRRRVGAARAELFHAYGSCSTTEPIEDLVALGMLA